jgi:hypothetical protein
MQSRSWPRHWPGYRHYRYRIDEALHICSGGRLRRQGQDGIWLSNLDAELPGPCRRRACGLIGGRERLVGHPPDRSGGVLTEFCPSQLAAVHLIRTIGETKGT